MVYSLMAFSKPDSCCHLRKELVKSKRLETTALISEVVVALLLIIAGSLALMSQAGLDLGPLNVIGNISKPVIISLQAVGAAWIIYNMVIHAIKHCKEKNSPELPLSSQQEPSLSILPSDPAKAQVATSDTDQPSPAPFTPPAAGSPPPPPPRQNGTVPASRLQTAGSSTAQTPATSPKSPSIATPTGGINMPSIVQSIKTGGHIKKNEQTPKQIIESALLFRPAKGVQFNLIQLNEQKLESHKKELVAYGVNWEGLDSLKKLISLQAQNLEDLVVDELRETAGKSTAFVRTIYEKLGSEKFAALFEVSL